MHTHLSPRRAAADQCRQRARPRHRRRPRPDGRGDRVRPPQHGRRGFRRIRRARPGLPVADRQRRTGAARPSAQRPLPAGRALHRPRRAGPQPDCIGYAGVTHRIAELTAPEVAARLAAGACAILPMGSLETHGPQAPMGDFLLAEAIADRIAAAASVDALVLPAIPFGGEDYFGFTPGGVVLTPALLQAVIEEVCGNLLRTGCCRILIVNGHAGSIGPVDAAARMLRRRHDVLIPAMHLWRVAGALHAELGGAPESFGHGGDPVWSVALHLRPDLCHPDRARAKQPVGPVLGLPVADFGTVR
ncbi:MAG: creatininase family protein, partial [Acetobacteraceae bacterium]